MSRRLWVPIHTTTWASPLEEGLIRVDTLHGVGLQLNVHRRWEVAV